MLIRVCLKSMKQMTKTVEPYPFWLENTPQTLRALIRETVHTCVGDFRARAASAENPVPLSAAMMEQMREVGKFAFGVHNNPNAVDEEKAVSTAMEAVSDGLVRIFRNGRELTDPDAPLDLREGDTLTFIRLTMLTGRMW